MFICILNKHFQLESRRFNLKSGFLFEQCRISSATSVLKFQINRSNVSLISRSIGNISNNKRILILSKHTHMRIVPEKTPSYRFFETFNRSSSPKGGNIIACRFEFIGECCIHCGWPRLSKGASMNTNKPGLDPAT